MFIPSVEIIKQDKKQKYEMMQGFYPLSWPVSCHSTYLRTELLLKHKMFGNILQESSLVTWQRASGASEAIR